MVVKLYLNLIKSNATDRKERKECSNVVLPLRSLRSVALLPLLPD